MTIIDKILVLLDGKDKLTFDEIYKFLNYSKQLTASTLGRLEAKGLIIKLDKKNPLFRISPTGKEYIDESLARLQLIKKHQFKKIHDNWMIVVFNIPEKKRKLRDDLRIFLLKNGFGRLQSSLWMSYWDGTKNINKYAKHLKIQNYITILFLKNLTNQEEKHLVKKINWNWININKLYLDFIKQAKMFLSSKSQSSFQAKLLVLNYAKIVGYDPKLPIELQPKHSLTQKAYYIYLKVRDYCYR